MAIATTANQFSTNMERRARQVITGAEKQMQNTALAVSDVAINTTPFLTGKARFNWLAVIGSPTYTDNETPTLYNKSANTNASKNRNAPIIKSWRITKGPIQITNGVPYIVYLENGSSKQAPSGMTRHAIQAGSIVSGFNVFLTDD